VRWTEVTEEGFRGGPVMPDTYDGSAKSVEQLKQNIARSGIVGRLVSNNFKSSMIFVPLLDKDAATGKGIDYHVLSRVLEDKVRAKFEATASADAKAGGKPAPQIKVHVIGFAKLIGELIDGLVKVMMFFGIAALIATVIIYFYTHCVRSTALVIACSIVAVIWQLGLIAILGFELDPFSILVPFLVFAIGVSHGAQKMNGIMQDIGRGTVKLVAARYTFRRLFLAGLTALLADAVGFAVLMLIDIPVIKDLVVTASIGVAVLIFTNLLLLPVLLSYTGVSAAAAQRSLKEEREETRGRGLGKLWLFLDRFTTRPYAIAAVAVSALLAVGGFAVSTKLQIGDLDPGAPELRPDSRYNRDTAYITSHYALSSDQFAVILKTPKDGCLAYETLVEADRLAWAMRQLPETQTTVSLVDAARQITAGSFEGNPKWLTINRNQDVLNYAAQKATGKDVVKIVFIGDKRPHGERGNHEFVAGALYMARVLNATYPRANAVVHPHDKMPKDLSHADAVIVLLNHGGSAVNPATKAAMDRGAGFMAIHYGVEVNKGEQGDAYLKWMGGYFETFWSVNPWWTPEFKTIPEHETTRGVKPFTVNDEWYYHMRFVDGMKGVTPILSATPDLKTISTNKKPSERGGNPDVLAAVTAGKPQHMAWAYVRPDGGRGFGFTGFHKYSNLENDSFRTLLLNACAWTAKLEVPAKGLVTPKPTREELDKFIDIGKRVGE
jgi:hypothetical protein